MKADKEAAIAKASKLRKSESDEISKKFAKAQKTYIKMRAKRALNTQEMATLNKKQK